MNDYVTGRYIQDKEKDALRKLDGIKDIKLPTLEHFFLNPLIVEWALQASEDRGDKPW